MSLLMLKVAGASFAAAVLLAIPAVARQKARKDIGSQVATLRQSVSTMNLPQEETGPLYTALDTVSKHLEQHRPNLALRDLLSAWASLGVSGFTHRHAAAKQDEGAYAQVFKDCGEHPAGWDKKSNPSQPLLARGLAEYARDQANGYYQAADAYGRQTILQAGLTYAGLGYGLLDFADFCDQVDLPGGEAPALRSIAPDLDALESRLLESYEGAGEASDIAFIQASQAIKTARELESRHQYAGSLIAYLVATRNLAQKTTRPLEKGTIIKLLDAERAKWSAKADNSVPRSYVELAMDGVERGGDGLVDASGIATEVLPQYRKLIGPAPATKKPSLSDRRVKVTLVRWPYT